MDGKLKFYASNEKSILESVKNTVVTAFEKTENLKLEFNNKIAEYESKIKSLQHEFDNYKNTTDIKLTEYNNKVEQLTKQLEFKTKYNYL
jgi:uncharacterized protein Yka (UPF0111/DUF47 family)